MRAVVTEKQLGTWAEELRLGPRLRSGRAGLEGRLVVDQQAACRASTSSALGQEHCLNVAPRLRRRQQRVPHHRPTHPAFGQPLDLSDAHFRTRSPTRWPASPRVTGLRTAGPPAARIQTGRPNGGSTTPTAICSSTLTRRAPPSASSTRTSTVCPPASALTEHDTSSATTPSSGWSTSPIRVASRGITSTTRSAEWSPSGTSTDATCGTRSTPPANWPRGPTAPARWSATDGMPSAARSSSTRTERSPPFPMTRPVVCCTPPGQESRSPSAMTRSSARSKRPATASPWPTATTHWGD